jgi:hypothetical protein
MLAAEIRHRATGDGSFLLPAGRSVKGKPKSACPFKCLASRPPDLDREQYPLGAFNCGLGHTPECVSNDQLRDRIVDEYRIEPFEGRHRQFDLPPIGAQCPDDLVGMLFARGRNIEDIPWFYAQSSMHDFLAYDFGDRFQPDFFAFDLAFRCRVWRFWQTDDEIDFTDIFKRNFHETGAVAVATAGLNFKFEIMCSRIEEWKQLGILQKKIDVTTLAMMDLQHHCGSATERPIVDDRRCRIDLPDEVTRDAE